MKQTMVPKIANLGFGKIRAGAMCKLRSLIQTWNQHLTFCSILWKSNNILYDDNIHVHFFLWRSLRLMWISVFKKVWNIFVGFAGVLLNAFSVQISVLLEKKAMVSHNPLYPIARLRTELLGDTVLVLFLKLQHASSKKLSSGTQTAEMSAS